MRGNHLNRREFLKSTGKAGIAAGFTAISFSAKADNHSGGVAKFRAPDISYQQEPLPYTYSALEPYIDAATMELHYSKHAAAYAKNLGEAVKAEGVDTANINLENLLAGISKYSAKMRNNAGGHYNHELFWKLMSPSTESRQPSGKITAMIEANFGSWENFRTQFSDSAKSRFGSGWAWLIYTHEKKLAIDSTPNQDNPLMDVGGTKGMPLMGIDVWEHAYYLKYHNLRTDYINAWWNLVNWQYVSGRLDRVL